MTETGVVNIHGRDYMTVALRVRMFRERYPHWQILTELLPSGNERVLIKCSIADHMGNVHATGHAEEMRGATQINKTSALENAETSAIGRALAALGFGGQEFASADEVQNAIHQQNQTETITEQQVASLEVMIDEVGAEKDAFLRYLKLSSLSDLPVKSYKTAVAALESKRRKK